MLNQALVAEIEHEAARMRMNVVEMVYQGGSGHLGGSLSVCEILAALYFAELNVDPTQPRDPGRDRLILSKGHAAPALYAALAQRGYFPETELATLRKIGSRLQGHPDMKKTAGIDISSGSLGMGISFGIGIALAARSDRAVFRTYVITGCGELDEGQNWEALMTAVKYRLDNLVVIVDYNRIQLDGSNDQIMPLGDLSRKFQAFDWHVLECDGHNVAQILGSLAQAREIKEQPCVIMAHTIKGRGVSFMENTHEWHGKELNEGDYLRATNELKGVSRHGE